MLEEQLEKLKYLYSALCNTNRLKLLHFCKDKEYTVAEISKKLKISYTLTSEYITQLERQGLVKKTKKSNNSVSIKSLVDFKENGEFVILK